MNTYGLIMPTGPDDTVANMGVINRLRGNRQVDQISVRLTSIPKRRSALLKAISIRIGGTRLEEVMGNLSVLGENAQISLIEMMALHEFGLFDPVDLADPASEVLFNKRVYLYMQVDNLYSRLIYHSSIAEKLGRSIREERPDWSGQTREMLIDGKTGYEISSPQSGTYAGRDIEIIQALQDAGLLEPARTNFERACQEVGIYRHLGKMLDELHITHIEIHNMRPETGMPPITRS